VSVDGADNVVLAGILQSPNVDFGGVHLSPPGILSLVLVKLSSAGALQWAKTYGTGQVVPENITIDRSNDIAVTGKTYSVADFGGGVVSGTMSGVVTTFVAKYSGADGSYRWARVFGGVTNDGDGGGVAADPHTGNIVVAGGFSGNADFGGGLVNKPAQAVFLAGYDSSGAFLWLETLGGAAGGSWANSVSFDANGNLALTGIKGELWFMNGSWNQNVGLFVATYSVAGNAAPAMSWFHCSGINGSNVGGVGPGSSEGTGVAFDGAGHVVATGDFSFGTVDFGGTSITTTPNSKWGFVTQYVQ
jgi:hypothetical protein